MSVRGEDGSGGGGSPRPRETAQTLERGLLVLEVLARREHARGLTVTEVAAATGLSRQILYRLLATLEQRAYVVRGPGSRVRLGLGLARLTDAVLPMVREQTLPVLRTLADDLGATAHLTVADGDEAVALVVVEPSWTDFHVGYRTGSRHPLSKGAAGRAILAARDGGGSAVASSAGELQPGASGLAAGIVLDGGLDCSVGVVALGELAPDAGERVARAAQDVVALLSGR